MLDTDEWGYWTKILVHWVIVFFLMWVGYENPDAFLIIMVIGWGTWLWIWKDGF
jgi:hypothetical protein